MTQGGGLETHLGRISMNQRLKIAPTTQTPVALASEEATQRTPDGTSGRTGTPPGSVNPDMPQDAHHSHSTVGQDADEAAQRMRLGSRKTSVAGALAPPPTAAPAPTRPVAPRPYVPRAPAIADGHPPNRKLADEPAQLPSQKQMGTLTDNQTQTPRVRCALT